METLKVLAIGTSSNRNSINLQLATYAARLIEGASVDVLSAADYEMPLYSDAREAELGSPEPAQRFMQKIAEADAIVISFAEYNGSYTASFKNLFDWASRIDTRVFQRKPTVFLSTSPGGGGAQSVLAQAEQSAKYYGADLVATLSVPKFREQFEPNSGLMRQTALRDELNLAMASLRDAALLHRGQSQHGLGQTDGAGSGRQEGRSKQGVSLC